jgi:hypothetical protein
MFVGFQREHCLVATITSRRMRDTAIAGRAETRASGADVPLLGQVSV